VQDAVRDGTRRLEELDAIADARHPASAGAATGCSYVRITHGLHLDRPTGGRS